jgi:uncharacterized sulfatase
MLPAVFQDDSARPGRGWSGLRRLGLLALSSLLLACGGGPPPPPNLVLVIGDDQGWPDFGFMGSQEVRTPRLDALAAESVVFPLGYSTSSLCRPALRTLLTGLHPMQYTRLHYGLAADSEDPVAAEQVVRAVDTLPRLLGERGYTSFEAGKYMEGHYAAAGFDAGMVEEVGPAGMRDADRLVRETMEPVFDFVDANADRPFFLWFAPKLPHLPHDAPARFAEPFREAGLDGRTWPYYAAISWFDEALGELLDHLDAAGLRERTLVVYLVDNGWDTAQPESLEHAVLGGPQGKKSLYELGFRTPILLRWPGTLEPARHEGVLISISDLFPTLLEAAGAPVPPDRIGHSLWPFLEGRAGPPRSELVGWTHAVRDAPGGRILGGFFWRDDRWHLLQPEGRPIELYDLAADPREANDVAEAHPDVVARGVRAIREWQRALPSAERREPGAKE